MSIPLTQIPARPPSPPIPVPEGGLDARKVREDFPLLRQKVHGKPLVYLDNAATTQKPQAVLDALRRYYTTDNANVHRGVHELSQRATRAYEEAREKVQAFLGARESREIVFTRGATEAINLVAASWGRANLKPGDEVIVSWMEHHSNIVPWQMVCEQTGAVLKAVPISDRGEFLFEEYEKLLGPRTKLVSVAHVSNSLGTVNPVGRIIERAHAQGARVLLDACQAVPHLPLDVQALDCDFLVFSGHKVYGPTGIGALYGKAELLEAMPPYQGGGDMIKSVSFAGTVYADPPARFEAGTPNIAGAIVLGAALDYLEGLGRAAVAAHEDALLAYATQRIQEVRGVRLIGTAPEKAAVLGFVVDDPPLSALDVGARLDLEGVAVRTGHHCCQPVMERFGVPATVRASVAVYSTTEDVDVFIEALEETVRTAAARCRVPTCGGCSLGPELVFPAKSAESPQEAGDELADVFEWFDDWNDRYRHILELGEKLPEMPEVLKTDANRVRGCQSTVYLQARVQPGTADVVEFLADSDADLVRGLIGVLQKLFSGQKAKDILAFDVEGYFARLGLDAHLSLNRRNGLSAMVQRVKAFASSLVQ